MGLIRLLIDAFVYVYYIVYKHLLYSRVVRKILFIKDKAYTRFLREKVQYMGSEVIIRHKITFHGLENVKIGKDTTIGKYCIITTWKDTQSDDVPLLRIGCNCSIGQYCHITCSNRIEIEDGVLLGRWVTITDNSHGTMTIDDLRRPPLSRTIYSKGPIFIGSNVWIGDKATILPNVRIGEGSVIGANSVVTKDVPSYSVVCGNPARVVKDLNNE